MSKHKKEKMSRCEQYWWYSSIISCLAIAGGICPLTPWRMCRVDTNVGNRFVMDRYYFLFGASDQFGKTVTWFSLKTKFKRKQQEYGRPSPLTAIIGTVGTMLGAGGASMGCAMWEVCKQHVASRYMNYTIVAVCGIVSALSGLIGMGCTIAAIVFISMEVPDSHKKKKKKDDDVCLSPRGWTMFMTMMGWAFIIMSTCTFLFGLDMALKDFKQTAYYPYATASGGPAAVGFAGFMQFINMVIAINRVTPLCGKKKEDDGEGEGEGEGMMGEGKGYGKGYGGPPPGAYGEQGPPGGKGGKW